MSGQSWLQGECPLLNDKQVLEQLNVQIGQFEDAGDVTGLAGVLAPRLAFQRADAQKTVDDQVAFLQKVQSGGPRTTKVQSVDLYGDRAIVTCVVTIGDKNYHNLRLFVRREGQWKLLGWANEPV